jgi:HD-GYP domain-containing protein (c-di-GMP phosphodiesterase class II)
MAKLTLAELMGSLSHALDITEGQPPGHCVRACWIGCQIGANLGVRDEALRDLYYTLLLKDLGCSSNAARICELYLTDDLEFKRDYKWVDGSMPKVLRFILSKTGSNAGLVDRLKAVSGILRQGNEIAHELIKTRCTRGADIARQLRFSESVAEGIHSLDEHWNGQGNPQGLKGKEIPFFSRIALLAQVVDLFNQADGPEAAVREAEERSGTWFEPELVDAFRSLSKDFLFWETLNASDIGRIVLNLEPAHAEMNLDDAFLDDIAEAFGQVVDAKSPYTAGHSARVGLYTALLSEKMELTAERRRWLKRGALLHDLGKLGVSNSILDKPGKLDENEWAAMRSHAALTGSILGKISALKELAEVSSAHHERLDGMGYPLGISYNQICLETRIITTADIFDAITADRPYRRAVPVEKTLSIMEESIGTALDPVCFHHLKDLVHASPEFFPT